MALQSGSKGSIVSSSIAAGCFEQQIKPNRGGASIEQTIQHRGMHLSRPGPLGQALEQGVVAEVCIGRLLKAEVIDGHDHNVVGRSPWAPGLLDQAGKTQVGAAQPSPADAAGGGHQSTEQQRCGMATKPAESGWPSHGVSDACPNRLNRSAALDRPGSEQRSSSPQQRSRVEAWA